MLYIVSLLLIFFLIRLLLSVNLVFTIVNLILVITYCQFFLSTYLVMNEYVDAGIYSMGIDQSEYFNLVTLYLIAFLFALNYNNLFFKNKISNVVVSDDLKNTYRGYSLIFFSLIFTLLSIFNIFSSINSITHYILFVGSFYLIFGEFKLLDRLIVFCIYFQLLLNSITQGIFIEFFIWIVFLYFVLSLRYQFSIKMKLIYLSILSILLLTIQGMKLDFRTILWDDKNEISSTDLFVQLSSTQLGKTNLENEFLKGEVFSNLTTRLNQGWHLEKAMNHVPSKVDFANGDEIFSDVKNSIVPRVLMPSKKTVTNRDKFIYYTGYNLSEGTSMSVGVFGDAYLNFGFYGFIFLFTVGRCFILFIKFFVNKYVSIQGHYIFWLPFFSHYLIRSGNDFYIVLNSFLKGVFVFIVIDYLWKKNEI